MYGYGYYGFDWTYLLLIIGMLLSLAASAKLKSTFARYKRVRSASGLTGEEAARRILYSAGITDVQVRPVAGSLTDQSKVLPIPDFPLIRPDMKSKERKEHGLPRIIF